MWNVFSPLECVHNSFILIFIWVFSFRCCIFSSFVFYSRHIHILILDCSAAAHYHRINSWIERSASFKLGPLLLLIFCSCETCWMAIHICPHWISLSTAHIGKWFNLIPGHYIPSARIFTDFHSVPLWTKIFLCTVRGMR